MRRRFDRSCGDKTREETEGEVLVVDVDVDAAVGDVGVTHHSGMRVPNGHPTGQSACLRRANHLLSHLFLLFRGWTDQMHRPVVVAQQALQGAEYHTT